MERRDVVREDHYRALIRRRSLTHCYVVGNHYCVINDAVAEGAESDTRRISQVPEQPDAAV
jgi:hypothetical protein